MKKSLFLSLLIAVLILFTGTHAQSIMIGFDPMTQDVALGGQAVVDLTISGLGSGMAPSLGGWDVDVLYDPGILSYNSVVFGDPVLGDQLDLPGDPFNLGPITLEIPLMGIVTLFEASFNDPLFLDANQADSFTLASLTFDAIGAGSSFLDVVVFGISDSFGNPLDLDAPPEAGAVNVQVPEPATMLLLGSGLAGIAFLRRRRIE